MDAAVSVAAGVGIAALLVTILGALPLFGFLGRRGVVNRAQVLVSGALLGNVPSVVILALTIASGWRQGAPLNLTTLAYSPIGLLRAIVYGSFLGMASACAFWLLAPKRVD